MRGVIVQPRPDGGATAGLVLGPFQHNRGRNRRGMLYNTRVFLCSLAHEFCVRRMVIVCLLATLTSISDLEGPLSPISLSFSPLRHSTRSLGDFVCAAAIAPARSRFPVVKCWRRFVLAFAACSPSLCDLFEIWVGDFGGGDPWGWRWRTSTRR